MGDAQVELGGDGCGQDGGGHVERGEVPVEVRELLGELERVLALHGRGGRERGGQWSARGRAELEQVQDAPGGGRVEAVVGLGEALEPLERTGKRGRGLG